MSVEMTDEQRAEMARIQDIVMVKVRVEVAAMAEMMVVKSNGEFFGETEFVLRDRCHTIGGHALDAALEQRNRHDCSLSRKGVPGSAGDVSALQGRSRLRRVSSAEACADSGWRDRV